MGSFPDVSVSNRVVPFDQEIPGLIPGSAMGFFSSGLLFHGSYGLGVSVSVVQVLS